MRCRNKNARQAPAGVWQTALALLLLASHASAQRTDWRFWKSSDGFPESFIRSVAAGANGSILVRHGAVESLSILDGYGVRNSPEIRSGPLADWGIRARAYIASNGDIWVVDHGELRRSRSGTWSLEAPRDNVHPMLAAVPAGDDRILVLFSDRLTAYSPSRRTWTLLKRDAETCLGSFTQLVPGFSSDFWITGETGVAWLQFGPSAIPSWTQTDIRRFGLEAATCPMPATGQVVYISARIAGRSQWAVVRWSAAGAEIVYFGNQDNLRGWQGPDGELWVLNGSSLWRTTGGRMESSQRYGSPSGMVYDVLAMPDGSFWLGTSDGLARYSPAIWRTPAPVADLDAPVHSVAEDAQGRLWFAATEYLVELDGTTWRRYLLPFGLRTHHAQAHSVLAFADGRISVKARASDGAERLLLFDPKSRRFETVVHPQGRTIGLVVPRPDGTFWVRTKPGYHIELYDGKTFRPQFDLPAVWKGDDVRSILETRDGTLWIGGPGGAIVGTNGAFRELRAEDGFTANGAFEIAEFGQNHILVGGREKLLHFDGHNWSVWRSGMDRVRMITQTRDKSLWVASGSGLHRLVNGHWLTNGEEEGLPATAVYVVFQDSRGRLWAGSDRGISLYHPEADQEPPSVRFAPAGNMRETAPDGHIRIFAMGIDRWKNTRAGSLLFSYRLDSDPWSPFAANDSATFDHLGSGPHRLSVRGMDRSANIAVSSTPYTFQVALPWYRQPGFYLIVFASGLMIVGLLGLAVSNYRQRSRFILELNNARLAAESASRHKSQFLANMSHEIRTPMNAIIGMTELALENAAEPQRGYLTTVQKASNSLLVLLNEVLDFSKIEAGKLELVAVDFDLRESIGDALRTLEARAHEKGLVLVLRTDPEVPRYVSADDRRLHQMMLNLLGNAIKFTSAGEIRVEIRLISTLGEHVELEFVVSDRGIGIPLDKQQTVFGAFEQADGSTTRKYGGTGLGLAICARLATLMHGRLWVESPWQSRESGQLVPGSAFHFRVTLPVGKAPVQVPARAVPVAPVNLRILLAEDNPVNQKVAVHLLRRRGHTVLVAGNGREALDIVKHEPLDIALMDVQMPEMDGFQATTAIRQWEQGRGSHLCIVALTAHVMDGDRDRCLAHGFDLYLGKPFRPEELDAVLAEGTGLVRPTSPIPGA